jgi:hypothetical protein
MHALAELRVLWLTLLLLGLADLALRGHVFKDAPSSLAALETWSAEPPDTPPTDVMIIGSSRFRPVQAERVAAGAAAAGVSGPRVVNASFNGGTWEATARLLDVFAPDDRLQRGPRLVLIGCGVMDANDGYRNPMVASRLWGPSDLFAHVWETGTDEDTRAYLFSVPPASESALLTAYRQKLLRAEVRDLALRLTARAKPAETAQTAERDVLDNAEAQRAGADVAGLADIPPPVGGAYVRDFHLGGSQTEALRSLVRRLRAAGVTPVLVDAPLSAWYRSGMIHGEEAAYLAYLRAFAEAEDVPAFALPLSEWGLGEADYFVKAGRFDGHHIASVEGRQRFAEALGRKVVAPLWARIRAGETPGFADGRLETTP